jgi:hypothetical protein
VESVSAAASVRSEPVVALTDEDAGTSWVCADEATLTVTLPEEADVAAIRLFSKDNAYPAVAEVFFQRSGTNWVGGGGAVDAKWFWSGPRPYFGEWMRRLEWRLAPCRTRMFRVRFTAHRKRPCVITELQVFEPADAEDPAGGAEEVLGFLDSVGADNVYCDRWLVNTLSSVSGGRITTPRRPDIYGGSITARDVSLKVGWTEGTAFVTSGRDAALCRRALENAGVSMTEAQAGGWTVFHFGSGDYSPLYRFGAPLEWVGYGCLGLEVGCETRVEFFCARAAELVRAGRRVEGLRLAERSLAEGPPSRSGMEALAAAFESAGMPAEAGAWRQSASSAWTPGL